MTILFKVEDGKLVKAALRPLSKESLIEDWVADDPGLLGLDAIVIGREVGTDHGKYFVLLALDRSGGLVIIELKKDRTPREIVAQVRDYASWVRTLTTPQIYELAERYRKQRLTTLYQDNFGDRIPERLNGSHSMLIVASELDPASKRIQAKTFRGAFANQNIVARCAIRRQWITSSRNSASMIEDADRCGGCLGMPISC